MGWNSLESESGCPGFFPFVTVIYQSGWSGPWMNIVFLRTERPSAGLKTTLRTEKHPKKCSKPKLCPSSIFPSFNLTQRRMLYTFPRLPEATRFVQLLLLEMGRSTRGRLADSFLLFSHSRQASLENEAIFPAKALGNYWWISLHTWISVKRKWKYMYIFF